MMDLSAAFDKIASLRYFVYAGAISFGFQALVANHSSMLPDDPVVSIPLFVTVPITDISPIVRGMESVSDASRERLSTHHYDFIG